ncbi:carbohydrate porin [Pseudohalioglobus lutimaris]|uniref:Uncharacterized protein n=1 Tax=Pseudohalioglobus lutimaris TaxID=1737061 RepID=A0A2N5WZL0_9GAMM|nr:carbohydrate porin [Pseudohalioglobus lutimaris]PLW67679.1 hypothetical protein C0039_15885 [Pseudohalioglobus lutimaris]
MMRKLQLSLGMLAVAGAAAGEETGERPHQTSYGELSVLEEYRDPAQRTGHLAMAPAIDALQPYFNFKASLSERAGIHYVVEYAPLFQTQLDGGAGNTAGDEANFILKWTPTVADSDDENGLLAWYQFQNTFTEHNTSEFMQRMGVLSPLNGGVTGEGNGSSDFLQHFAWEQHFGERWRLMAGKLTSRVLLNLNRYAISDREDFFSPMLVNNPVVPYTGRLGLGAFVEYKEEQWYVSTMVRQAGGTSQWFEFDELHADELEYVAEIALTPENVFGLGEGVYRFTPSWTDAVGDGVAAQPSGWSISVSADQDIGDKLGALFRYAYANEDFRDFKQRLSLGAQIKQPLGMQNDRIGVGAWWGEPTDRDLDGEYGLDAFWMIQVAPFMELSADLQLVLDPALSNRNQAWMGGLRMRFVF